MREAAFLKQNKDKWVLFEAVLDGKKEIVPDKLADLYLEVTDDLSFAQTFYPESNTYLFLNGLASKAHQQIYKSKKTSKNRLISFFKTEFPLLFYQYQRQLIISFVVFVIFTIIGAFSAHSNGDFVRLILGDDYVNTTLENIAQGKPMAIYSKAPESKMFLVITLNNIKVALFTFLYGILLGLGTLYMLMQNGIMLGSFTYFFSEHHLLWESSRTIWIHGTIEISVIIVAGCAGLVLGTGLLFPGTYSRLESFKRHMKDGLKIMVSTIPFFIIAGFLEGFVTRHTEMPDWLSITIIILSLSLVIGYYVIYPIQLNKTKLKHEKSD